MSVWQTIREIAIDIPVGAILRVLGASSATDKTRSVAFTIALIALSAKMARADGVVSQNEIAAFGQILHVPDDEKAHVNRVFDMAKQDMAGYDSYARQVAKMFADRPGVLEDVLDALFHIAKADLVVHPVEIQFLEVVAGIFGFDERAWKRIKASHLGRPDSDAYSILGADPDDANDVLRKAYRTLVKEHHPDALIARGVPQEFIDVANERLATINGAWEEISRERGI